DPRAVAALMRHACIPAPLTVYQGVYKLLPAHILSVSQSDEPELICYWDLRQTATDGRQHIDNRPHEELVAELDLLLRDAVQRQMVSDVPLGAFLSGGIDSSTVVALMQAQSNRRVHTFSIGSAEAGFDEAKDAQRVARHLGTEHTELYVTEEQVTQAILRLPTLYDEPFSDS